MSTISKLEDEEKLIKFDCELEGNAQPQRLIYAHPRVANFVENELPNVESLYPENTTSPAEQLDEMFHQFCSGGNINVAGAASWMHAGHDQEELKELRCEPRDVWEFKTQDLRIFGWFHTPDIFIVSNISMKSQLEQYAGEAGQDLYPRICAEAINFRGLLGLEDCPRPTYQEISNGLQN